MDSYPPIHVDRNEGGTISWLDAGTQSTVVVARPSVELSLWNDYLEGAHRSYQKHGVECVLDIETVRDGADTTVFFAAVDSAGRVLGGTRIVGPLRSAEDSHAVVEWAESTGLADVRNMIDSRIPFGVVEGKTAWTASDSSSSRSLFRLLVRCPIWAMYLLDVQYVMSTAPLHVLQQWRSSGGVVASGIPVAAYPNDRYETRMMFWDRATFADNAEPDQLALAVAEASELISAATLVEAVHR
jgi:hypothetical protein